MKLFVLINSLKTGGAERLIVDFVKRVKFEKIILLEKDIVYTIDYKNILVLSRFKYQSSIIKKYLYLPIYVYLLLKHIDENSIVISALQRSNFINVITKYFSRHRAVIWEHSVLRWTNKPLKKKINNLLIKILYKRADAIVSSTELSKLELVNEYKVKEKKVEIIKNFIDFEAISEKTNEPIESEFTQLFDDLVVMNVGRLSEAKGQWYLIRAFQRVVAQYPGAKLLIFGDGEEKSYLEDLIRNLELESSVFLMGFHENPFKFLAKATVFVLPSLWESFGNVIIESMACGCPVIASDCDFGPREILSPVIDVGNFTDKLIYTEYGILVPKCDGSYKVSTDSLTREEALISDAISEIFDNKELRLRYREQGYKRALDFSMEKIIPQWRKVIDDDSRFDA